MIREGVALAVALQLCLDEWLLVEVLALLFVLVNPQVWEHLCNLYRHQSGEDRIAGILGGGGQDAAIDILVNVEQVANLALQHLPLVVAEVVEHDEEHLLAIAQQGEHLALEELIRQHRVLCTLIPSGGF